MIAENKHKPNIITNLKLVGSLTLKFEGEQHEGNEILDTKVTINGAELCYITWSDRESFVNDLKQAIEKYFI